jgi:deoxycytidine triphosphate deaminase
MIGEWNPFEETKAPPESVRVFGIDLRVGDRIRIWPQKSADIIDIALKGQVAVIEAIEQDFENHIQFAVVLDNDPGREFGMMRQPGHRFFFSPEEVEPMDSRGPA